MGNPQACLSKSGKQKTRLRYFSEAGLRIDTGSPFRDHSDGRRIESDEVHVKSRKLACLNTRNNIRSFAPLSMSRRWPDCSKLFEEKMGSDKRKFLK
jgi:hypothetical protein